MSATHKHYVCREKVTINITLASNNVRNNKIWRRPPRNIKTSPEEKACHDWHSSMCGIINSALLPVIYIKHPQQIKPIILFGRPTMLGKRTKYDVDHPISISRNQVLSSSITLSHDVRHSSTLPRGPLTKQLRRQDSNPGKSTRRQSARQPERRVDTRLVELSVAMRAIATTWAAKYS